VQSFWGDYDIDKGGTLDEAEIRTFLEDILGESIDQNTFEKFYKVLDEDGDGEIDDMEMIRFIDNTETNRMIIDREAKEKAPEENSQPDHQTQPHT
jgi:Ca2+-binding EF-hand superfamily protein